MRGCLAIVLALGCVFAAHAQEPVPGMTMPTGSNASASMLLNQSSGTDVQPSAWTMPQLMKTTGGWQLMFMGQAFGTDIQQTGLPQTQRATLQPTGPSAPQATGQDKLYSTNWGMLAAVRPVGAGAVMLRSMLSLEPATISDRRYPELFQTGETAYGVPLVNGQHPHNFVMEVAAALAEPLGDHARGYLYYAPVGDPALGPPAYPHRASAAEFPQAALGHHYEDSTHIADNVATLGASVGVEREWLRLEASGFYGREPGENRLTIGFGGMDSWSARAVVSPSKNLTMQASTGRLTHPEQASGGDEERTTASAEYVRPRPMGAHDWASSVIWGRDYKTDGYYAVNAITAESVLPAGQRNLLTARYEWSQRDELFDNNAAVKQAFAAEGRRWFDVSAFTPGYTRVIRDSHNAEVGLGFNVTAYYVPDAIRPYFGSHPFAASVYLRVRLKDSHSPSKEKNERGGMGDMPMAMDCC